MVTILDQHVVFLYLNISHKHTSFQLVTRDNFKAGYTFSNKKISPNSAFDLSMSKQQPGCESHHANYYR